MTYHLQGVLIVPPADMKAVREELPNHIAATRAEPGCVTFEAKEMGEGRFAVLEVFDDRAAFDVHFQRLMTTRWAEVSANCQRDYRQWEE